MNLQSAATNENKTHLVGLCLQFRLLPEWFEPFSFDGPVHGEIVAR
jgi:hypothetical protein